MRSKFSIAALAASSLLALTAAGCATDDSADTSTSTTSGYDAGAGAGSSTGAAATDPYGASAGTGAGATAATPTASGDVVAVASADPELSTLKAAIESAGLTTTLQGAGPYTIFAPSNAAFEALPKADRDKLMTPAGKAKLTQILSYHVVPGVVMASDVNGKKGSVKTVQGASLVADGTMGGVKINDANVTRADVPATNGVIHVVDKVLMPDAAAKASTKSSTGGTTGGASGGTTR